MSIPIDPFTQVHEALWAKLRAWRPFTQAVRPGNRVEAQPDALPSRPAPSDADRPSVAIVPAGGKIDLWATSAAANLSESYEVRVATGDPRPHRALSRVKWEVLRALASGDDRLGLPFVTGMHLESVRESRDDSGWTAVLLVRVTMSIPRSELLA